jgi:adenylylsulfate kinase-like enzyme
MPRPPITYGDREFHGGDCVTVMLTGPIGSGKTCLARWIAEMLTARGIYVERYDDMPGNGDKLVVELIHPHLLTMESMKALRRVAK